LYTVRKVFHGTLCFDQTQRGRPWVGASGLQQGKRGAVNSLRGSRTEAADRAAIGSCPVVLSQKYRTIGLAQTFRSAILDDCPKRTPEAARQPRETFE
jgi:hypothetical protein